MDPVVYIGLIQWLDPVVRKMGVQWFIEGGSSGSCRVDPMVHTGWVGWLIEGEHNGLHKADPMAHVG